MYAMTPMLHMSTAFPYGRFSRISGATYPGVPQAVLSIASFVSSCRRSMGRKRKSLATSARDQHQRAARSQSGKPILTLVEAMTRILVAHEISHR